MISLCDSISCSNSHYQSDCDHFYKLWYPTGPDGHIFSFQGLNIFIDIIRIEDDGLLQVKIIHSLYGYEQIIIRCIRLSGFQSSNVEKLNELLSSNHYSKRFVVEHDNGMILIGTLYIKVNDTYVNILSLIPNKNQLSNDPEIVSQINIQNPEIDPVQKLETIIESNLEESLTENKEESDEQSSKLDNNLEIIDKFYGP
jgi:hypothetical protein